jgi:death-on-curing protein
MQPIRLEDFLLIAERVLHAPAEAIMGAMRIGAAGSALGAPFSDDGQADRYPDLAAKAAVLCSRIVRNHPLPDGNKRVALIAMLEFLERNGARWTPPPGGQDEVARTMLALAARELSEAELARWVRSRIGDASAAE